MPHHVGSDQQRLQHDTRHTETTRSLHQSWHGACQRHLSKRSHLVVAFLYCQFTTEGLDIRILNIQEHKKTTMNTHHRALLHSNISTTIAMVHNTMPTQLNTKYYNKVSTVSPILYAHCQTCTAFSPSHTLHLTIFQQ